MMNRVVIVGRIKGPVDLSSIEQRQERLATLRLAVPRHGKSRGAPDDRYREDLVQVVTSRKDLVRLLEGASVDGRMAFIEGTLGQVRTRSGLHHAVILNRQGQFRLLERAMAGEGEMAA